MKELMEHAEGINRLMARYGVKFGIYKNGEFHEQLFPFDAIPRVISHEDFKKLEKRSDTESGCTESVFERHLRRKKDHKR